MFSFPSRNQRSIINCKEKQTDVGVNPCAAYTTFISKVCISFPLQAIGTNCCSSPLLSQPLSYLLSLRAADELNTHTHTHHTHMQYKLYIHRPSSLGQILPFDFCISTYSNTEWFTIYNALPDLPSQHNIASS